MFEKITLQITPKDLQTLSGGHWEFIFCSSGHNAILPANRSATRPMLILKALIKLKAAARH